MKSRGVRVFVVILAVAALAASGLAAWHFEQRVEAERSAGGAFESEARQAVIGLGDLRAAQQAGVAAGQAPGPWLVRSASLREALGPKIAELRVAAVTVEARGALEAAIEAFAAFGQTDERAREYLKAGQSISASDVIFADAAPTLDRIANLIDSARGQESIARAVAVAGARTRQAVVVGAGLFVALLALILLAPIPREDRTAAEGDAAAADGFLLPRGAAAVAGPTAGHKARPESDGAAAPTRTPGQAPRPPGGAAPGTPPSGDRAEAGAPAHVPDLDALAGVCSALARVQNASDLQGLFEPTAEALGATGIIVWMPDTAHGALRPALSHGYATQTIVRMGGIAPSADNATATAFRTRTVVVVPPEAQAAGAIVAPLISAEGCSGAMAVELRPGVDPSARVRAAAAIVAAQLATLLTPADSPDAAQEPATPAAGPAARKG